jgi:hypothetical protein
MKTLRTALIMAIAIVLIKFLSQNFNHSNSKEVKELVQQAAEEVTNKYEKEWNKSDNISKMNKLMKIIHNDAYLNSVKIQQPIQNTSIKTKNNIPQIIDDFIHKAVLYKNYLIFLDSSQYLKILDLNKKEIIKKLDFSNKYAIEYFKVDNHFLYFIQGKLFKVDLDNFMIKKTKQNIILPVGLYIDKDIYVILGENNKLFLEIFSKDLKLKTKKELPNIPTIDGYDYPKLIVKNSNIYLYDDKDNLYVIDLKSLKIKNHLKNTIIDLNQHLFITINNKIYNFYDLNFNHLATFNKDLIEYAAVIDNNLYLFCWNNVYIYNLKNFKQIKKIKTPKNEFLTNNKNIIIFQTDDNFEIYNKELKKIDSFKIKVVK